MPTKTFQLKRDTKVLEIASQESTENRDFTLSGEETWPMLSDISQLKL